MIILEIDPNKQGESGWRYVKVYSIQEQSSMNQFSREKKIIVWRNSINLGDLLTGVHAPLTLNRIATTSYLISYRHAFMQNSLLSMAGP